MPAHQTCEPRPEEEHVMSSESRAVDRTTSYGQGYQLSLMDRAGVWLNVRQIRRSVRGFAGKRVADFGCGYDAVFVRSILDEVAHVTVVDLALADDLKQNPKVTAIEGELPGVLSRVESQSLDVAVCNNVLEHLWEPTVALQHVRRALRPGGVAYLNVPSWQGKVLLETAAFRLGLTSPTEVDDHKAYYDRRELWRLVVASGFKPSRVECRSHKFGMNTFAVCGV
jgi:2-polyprenyl-3-methyl-5-hydroxy-6-metoxy-1,4-benzoquinol methylase